MKRLLLVTALLLFSLNLLANVPAPFWPCKGKKEGDTCTWGYGCGSYGSCVLDTRCTDDPATEINECLNCQTK